MDSNIQLTLFDYDTLDAETRIVVQQRTSEIKALMKKTAQDIIEIGEKLIEVKGKLPHGGFGGWLAAEFEWTPQHARRFMAVADAFNGQNEQIERFAPSALYLLAAPSTPDDARAEAIERAEAGERITHAAAKDIVADHKPPPPPQITEPDPPAPPPAPAPYAPQHSTAASGPARTPEIERPEAATMESTQPAAKMTVEPKPKPAPPPPPPPTVSEAPLSFTGTVQESGQVLITLRRGMEQLAMTSAGLEEIGQVIQGLLDEHAAAQSANDDDDEDIPEATPEWLEA